MSKKVQALEIIKDHPYYPEKDDVITVPDEYADRWVAHGWAKNVDTGEVGERATAPVDLVVDSASHVTKDTN